MTALLSGSGLSDQDISEVPSLVAAGQGFQKQTIAITATFTAELVEGSLAYLMQELALPTTITFAPYNQIFQQLLDPMSLLAQNQRGINVLLMRFEDWLRFEMETELWKIAQEKIEHHVCELIQAVQVAVERSSTPYLVCICPASPAIAADADRQAFFAHMEDRLAQDLVAISGVYLIRSTEVLTTYPVEEAYDPYGDKAGHIPYTPLFFAALGTQLARRIYTLVRIPYKVIVLDCDQTLWQGVCGEDGALGVVIDGPRQHLQEFLIAQQAAGMLLCLCSKNNEQDVLEVFACHPTMRLQREHLIAWRINWQPKSQNLRSLAEELQLSLESFIFIDDNPLECAEVQANCPEVLTFLLPEDLSRLPHLLQHFWAFDHLATTAEDKKRTELYVQQIKRQTFQKAFSSLKDFLQDLELQVQITSIGEAELQRVAQLTQRTNQFNCTTIRRTESEIRQFCQAKNGSEGECLVFNVSDRFGDYGLVGVMLFTVRTEELEVDTFLLSCRAMGRGVEHQMLARLGEIAYKRGVERVLVPFIPTAKNTPAQEFLESMEVVSRQIEEEKRWSFSFASKALMELVYTPLTEKAVLLGEELADKSPNVVAVASATPLKTEAKRVPFLKIATELSTAGQVLMAVAAQRQRHPSGQEPAAAPRTRLEEQLVDIWAEVLKLDRVGIHDDFFALGGGSLQATQIASRLYRELRIEVPLRYFVEAPTVARLTEIVTQLKAQDTRPRTEETKTHSRSVISAVQTSGSRRPFFFLHGQWTGDALYNWELAHYLGADQPFYLLEPYKFEGLVIPPTFEAVAAAHVEALRTVQPEGPYQLGGWCNGGLMAYEMARQLHAQGQMVELLVLMDPDPPVKSWKWERRIINRLGNLLRLRQEKLVDWFLLYRYLRLSFWYWKLNKFKHMRRTTKHGESGIERSSVDAISEQLDVVISRNEVLRHDWLSLYDWMVAGYMPHSYSGKITFFWTDDEPFRRERWLKTMKSKIQANEAEFHIIPGNHITSRTQYFPVLAEQLGMCINNAQRF